MRRTYRVRSAASRGEMLMWRTGIMFARQRSAQTEFDDSLIAVTHMEGN